MNVQIRQFEDVQFVGLEEHRQSNVQTEIVQLDNGIKLTILKGEVDENCRLPTLQRCDELTMVFVASGSVRIAAKTSRGHTVLDAGDAGLFSSGPTVLHATNELSVVFIELPRAYVTAIFGVLCPDGLKSFIDNDPTDWIYREIPFCASIQSVLHQMSAAPVSASLHSLFLTSKTYELVALGLERLSMENSDCRLTPADIERLKRARDILSESLSDPPSLIALAHEVGINDFKLKKGFKILFDTTPFGYLKERRMLAAHTALMKGEESVTTVANQVGYTNLGHFAAAFRKQFGTTPKAIKKISRINIGGIAKRGLAQTSTEAAAIP